MNGKDGQPYKTRSGGVMRLESLINEVNEAVLEKMKDNPDISAEEAAKTSKVPMVIISIFLSLFPEVLQRIKVMTIIIKVR